MPLHDRSSGPAARLKAFRTTQPRDVDPVGRGVATRFHLEVVFAPAPTAGLTIGASAVRIGRDAAAGADLVLPDPSVSRVHATLSPVAFDDTLLVTDNGSSNGTFLNGVRVERAGVGEGDVLRVGDSILVVEREPIAPADDDDEEIGLVGRSPAMRAVRSIIRRVAPSALPVLICGPTGTGKELVANALHARSGRRGPLVAINCAALPGALVEGVLFGHKRGAFTSAVADQEGAFVRANGGTLFLDEVGDLPREAQPKLLRALESGEVYPIGASLPLHVDVRVVAATNVGLDAALESGAFRGDLYARLAGVLLTTPPLAARRGDILGLFRSFRGTAQERPLSPDFVEALACRAWPHNVRELRRLAERLEVLHPDAARFERGMLDDERGRSAPSPHVEGPAAVEEAGTAIKPPSREELVELLERCGGNVSRVAELVHRNRKQVYRWLEIHGLDHGIGRR